MEDFITAAVFTYPHEIAILRHRLEQEKISYFFENETMLSVAPMYSYALGGIRLKVHPEELALVKSIIAELSQNDHLNIV